MPGSSGGEVQVVKALRRSGYAIGMCDGANDAPALRQVQMGWRSRLRTTWPNVLRERGRLWSSRPIGLMMISLADIVVVSTFAVFGALMHPLPVEVVLALLAAAAVAAVLLDQLNSSSCCSGTGPSTDWL